jgi:hypothetical protein
MEMENYRGTLAGLDLEEDERVFRGSSDIKEEKEEDD